MQKPRLWIVTELFYPDDTATAHCMTEIANFLSNKYQISVICGPHSQINSVGSTLHNIDIYRISLGKTLDKNSLFQRLLKLFLVSISIISQLVKLSKKRDKVLCVTNPALMLPLLTIICHLKKMPLSILVHDVFPENLIPSGIISQKSILYKFLKLIFDKTYNSCEQLIVLGRDMKKVIEDKIKRFDNNPVCIIIENWADVDTIYPINKNKTIIYDNLDLQNKIIFQFAGNIGRLQGLDLLTEAISECSNDLLHFVFIGEGAFKNKLKGIVNTKELSNLTFLDSFSRSRQNEFLNACDVGIVSLYDSMLGLGVPSKSYNILAAGKPILYLGNRESEIALMVNEYQVGWQFEMNDKKGLINFFNRINSSFIYEINQKGIRARLLAEKNYSKATILKKYAILLTSPPYSPPSTKS